MYLQQHGAEVEVTDDVERATYRSDVGIPDEMASCHTAVVEGYAIEGHVPVGAIVELLEQQPDVVGLALPGMPPDSPGMGGDVSTWEQQPVMLVADNGSVSPFDY